MRYKQHAYPLLRGVGIIETNEQLSLVHLREVLVEHGGLRVPNVQVATRFGRETRDNLALLSIL